MSFSLNPQKRRDDGNRRKVFSVSWCAGALLVFLRGTQVGDKQRQTEVERIVESGLCPAQERL